MYSEEFQAILNFFPQNHMFYTILNLLICISKNDFKKPVFVGVCKIGFFALRGGGQKVTDMSAIISFF